jgi:hypothetical protein
VPPSLAGGNVDTVSDTEESSRQLSALDRLHRKINGRFLFKHHEHRASEYDFCGDTVINTVRHFPIRSRQSLGSRDPNCGRTSHQKAYNACRNRGDGNVLTARQEDVAQPRPKAPQASAGALHSMSEAIVDSPTTRYRRVALSRVQRQVTERSGHPRRLLRDGSSATAGCGAIRIRRSVTLEFSTSTSQYVSRKTLTDCSTIATLIPK